MGKENVKGKERKRKDTKDSKRCNFNLEKEDVDWMAGIGVANRKANLPHLASAMQASALDAPSPLPRDFAPPRHEHIPAEEKSYKSQDIGFSFHPPRLSLSAAPILPIRDQQLI